LILVVLEHIFSLEQEHLQFQKLLQLQQLIIWWLQVVDLDLVMRTLVVEVVLVE